MKDTKEIVGNLTSRFGTHDPYALARTSWRPILLPPSSLSRIPSSLRTRTMTLTCWQR